MNRHLNNEGQEQVMLRGGPNRWERVKKKRAKEMNMVDVLSMQV
jgi:hypothetical protein